MTNGTPVRKVLHS